MFHDFLIFQLKNRAQRGNDADFPDSLRNICLFEGESLGTISHLDDIHCSIIQWSQYYNWKFLERKRALNCDCKLLVQNINTMGTFLA